MNVAPGTLLTPTLRLVRPLREGGMGSVWVADHLALRTQVVVKFMAESYARDEAALARFSREASAAAQVKSPHVVQTLDYGFAPGGQPFIVMEQLDGVDLGQLLRSRGALSPREVVSLVEQVARALTKAHERGIVHRDIKPSNIFLCDVGGREPFVKLLDFGIAKGVDDLEAVTTTGEVVGTPSYMSPEQISGERQLDGRSDLWSLGVVAYRALVGRAPFTGDNVPGIALAVVSGPLPRPSDHAPLPPAFDAWFATACARDKSQRFASAAQMAEALGLALGVGEAPSGRAIGVPPAPPSWPTHPSGARAVAGALPIHETTGTARGTSVSFDRAPSRSSVSGFAIGAIAAAVLGSVAAITYFTFGRQSSAAHGSHVTVQAPVAADASFDASPAGSASAAPAHGAAAGGTTAAASAAPSAAEAASAAPKVPARPALASPAPPRSAKADPAKSPPSKVDPFGF